MSVSEYLPSTAATVKADDARPARTRWLLWGLGLVVLLGLAWLGYRLLMPSKPHAPPAAPVRTAHATKKDVTVVQDTIATAVSPATVQVTAQVQGKLLTAYFQEGQLVKKGDPLFLIDPAPFQNALDQAKAQTAKDIANLQSAQNDEKRYTTLYAQNAISQQQRDQAVATALADAATVDSDKAAVNIAAENLGYTHIVSPIDGKTGPIQIQPGNVIMVGGATASGTPLVTITQIQPIKLSFFLPQSQLAQIQNQMTAGKLQAVVPMVGAAGGKEQALVDFVSNMVGSNTGTIELRATFANDDQRLVPGQNVNVGITMGQIAGATIVPRDAVNVGPDSSYVYVVDKDDVVSSKTVKVLNDDGTVDAIQGDVKPGDQVVVEGQLRITPGSKVAVRNKGRARASKPASDFAIMNISRIFIERPVLTTLIMAALVIFGLFGYSNLPVSELPAVDFPTISVSAGLPGADPSTMASAVATPLESQFSTIPGVSSMTSSSSLGKTSITIQFELDRNIDGAAEDVLAAIQQAARQLPVNMPSPPTLRKVNPADAPILFAAIQSDSMPLYELDKYAENLLARQLSTLSGVAQVNVFGAAAFAVRLQMDPTALAARNIGIDQVATAVQQANVDTNTGQLNGPSQATLIHVNGQLSDAAHWNKQIIAYRNGAPVRVQDVGQAIDSYQNTYAASFFNGKRAIVLSVQRQPGSNTIAIVDQINQVIPRFIQTMPKSAHLTVFYDRSQTIRDSVADVQTTLLIAAVLVVAVIFVFLRTLSATIIPSLALPIAVIGTFAAMSLLGYSLDNLSLMALTLSVGFIVDDAIVMLENIVRHVEEGEKPRDAAFKGSSEIAFTILSMTISLAAVFIPVVFMGGIIGRLLHEFAVTIVCAILISGVISVTLTPMLCSRFIKPGKSSEHGKFYQWTENAFDRVQRGYERSLGWSMNHSPFIMVLFGASLVLTVVLFMTIKTDFIPSEDTGQINVNTESADRTSFTQMSKYQAQLADIASHDPNVEAVMSTVGGGGARSGTNTGNMLFKLKPTNQRSLNADEVIQELRPKLARVLGVNAFMQNPPVIRVGGAQSKSLYQYVLQSTNMTELQQNAAKLTGVLQHTTGFADVTNDMDFNSPSVEVQIDRDLAASHGVSINSIETALGAAFGGEQISTIYATDAEYWVMLELLPQYQNDINDLKQLYISSSMSSSGTSGGSTSISPNGASSSTSTTSTASTVNSVVPLGAVTTLVPGTQALAINHLGQLPAVTISFNLLNGYTLSDAVSAISQASEQVGVPSTVLGQFQGQAQAFQSSMGNMGLLLTIAIITVYIILGILYESFVHPLTILSGLPSAAVGALITLWLFGVPLSLYAFVGMIMLIGIVKKNAIMMIDFALHRERGEEQATAHDAIFEAALVRFRPIMMTTLAALMGTLPVAIGLGAGSEARRPLGLAVVGGLMLSQALTLYITPVIYVYLDNAGKKLADWHPFGGKSKSRDDRGHTGGAAPHPAPAE